MSEQYPSYHENDIWEDIPDYVFRLQSISLGTVNAAKFLGMSHMSLLKYADDLGLTVLRRPGNSRRYFLVSELKELKEAMNGVTLDDLRKGNGFEVSKNKKKARAKTKRPRRR